MSSFAFLRKVIKYSSPKRSLLFKGVHGIGKTEWVTQVGLELGLKVVIWHASHAADATDVTGMPRIMTETIEWIDKVTGEHKTKTRDVMKMIKPDWMLQEEPVLLLLDELNRASPIIQNAIMELTNNQTYDGITLPEGSRIIACINPNEDGKYEVTSFDAAQLSRFSVYDVTPTTEEWLDYAMSKGICNEIISFIKANDKYLDPYTNQELVEQASSVDCGKLPDRRAWFEVSNVIKNGRADDETIWDSESGSLMLCELVQGIVGMGAAYDFIEHFKNSATTLNPRTILNMDPIDEETMDKITDIASKDIPKITAFLDNCTLMMSEHLENMKVGDPLGTLWVNNMYRIMDLLPMDALVSTGTKIIYTAIQQKKAWALAACKINPDIKNIVRRAKISRTDV